MSRVLKILQVNAADRGGGAAKIAHDLFSAYQQSGHTSWFAVGKKYFDDPNIIRIPNHVPNNLIEKAGFFAAQKCTSLVGKIKGMGKLKSFITTSARPANYLAYLRGHEQFYYPASRTLLDLIPEVPDIVHLHNLHAGYFDLTSLPALSKKVPVVMTLHDTWLLSGHCAYAITCDRWKQGCGKCPDLSLYPAVSRDATAFNWQRKKQIYQNSTFSIITPSQWLMNKVHDSMLMAAQPETKVIHNGVDLEIFKPGNKQQARDYLGLPQDAKIILFAANSIRTNIWKDYQTIKSALAKLSLMLPDQKILLVGLGDDGPPEHVERARVMFVPYNPDTSIIAQYYQAADVYVHAAKADTFPTVILESLACGTPVVATAIDGIPEQIKGLDCNVKSDAYSVEPKDYDAGKATGMLFARGDSDGIAQGLFRLLSNDDLLRQLAENAIHDARERFDQKRQVEHCLAWYNYLLTERRLR